MDVKIISRGDFLRGAASVGALSLFGATGASLAANDAQVLDEPGKGVFILMRQHSLWDAENVLSKSYVAGVTLYYSWRNLEPTKGVLDGTSVNRIRNLISLAGLYGKKVNLGITAGRNSPDWVYNNSVNSVPKVTYHVSTTKTESGPDQFSQYVWIFFYDAMGRLAAALPASSAIERIQISGPSNDNSIEMNYRAGRVAGYAFEREWTGYTPLKYESGWKRSVNEFAAKFPNRKLSLALHYQLGWESTATIAHRLSDYIRSRTNTLNRQALMLLGLEYGKGFFAPGSPYKDILLDELAKDPKQVIGLQMVKIFKDFGEPGNGLEASVRKGKEFYGDNFRWVEIWWEDFDYGKTHPEYEQAIRNSATLF
jgi:hypothetical protein